MDCFFNQEIFLERKIRGNEKGNKKCGNKGGSLCARRETGISVEGSEWPSD
jgi:hypothetical protein